jgi:SAM-dependent methyltransferase
MITLSKTSTEFGEITIVQSRTEGSHTYWQGDWRQSEADRHGVSLATYVHAIFGMLVQTPARNILMIGCGGGTLGTMLVRAGRSVTIIDINPQSIALARQYFSLPEEAVCHVADGASFLARTPALFDAIIIDAFIEGRIPQHLRSLGFFRLVRDRLAATGCVFINVFLRHRVDPSAGVMAGRLAHAGFHARVLVSRRLIDRNAIVMGGAVTDLRAPALHMRPEVLPEQIEGELQKMRFQGGRRSWNSHARHSQRVNHCEAVSATTDNPAQGRCLQAMEEKGG